MQGAAHFAAFALGVERFCVGDGGRVDLDDRIQHRPRVVDLFDAIEIRLREGTRRERARRHAVACLDRAELDDVESWR